MYFDQHEYDVRFLWGLSGIQALAAVSDVIIIVDVLSFTTCVDIVVGRGGFVYPYRDRLESMAGYADSIGASMLFDVDSIFPELTSPLLPDSAQSGACEG